MSRTKALRIASLFLFSAWALPTVGCSSSSSTPTGSSGATQGSGGTTASGSGGAAQGSGGTTAQGSGGTTQGSGGSSSSGSGGAASGGTTGTSSGGAPGTGGAVTSSGGATGSGGAGGAAPGTGGATVVAKPALVTSGPSGYWQTGAQWTVVTSGNADVTVNDTSTAQTWEGFGGAFNEKGWSYVSMLSATDRDAAIKLLFGDDGARFNMGRIPMGASDYALDRYTLDEMANDTSLTSFSIARDMMNIIPYVKAALAQRSNIRFWASPWTPPTWMKSSPFTDGMPFDGGNMMDDDTILKTHAQYFVKFVQEYAKQGIAIEAVAPQNEPNYNTNYPSCLWATALYTKFVGKYLGPAFETAGTGTKIMLGTMSNANSDPAIVSAVLADATAKKYIAMVGMQWDMINKISGAQGFAVPIWQSEHKAGNCPFSGSANCATITTDASGKAPNDQAYGVESWNLIRDWIKAGITAYNAWNMILDTSGISLDSKRAWLQNSLLVVDTSAKKLIITPAYYVFRHFSQFADPGAKVVGTTGGDAIAFKNPDGSLIAVMYNSGAARKMTVAIAGKKLQFDMPASGWATVNTK
ncbi:MAG TPA: glycoside hydrolase family 30 protein [Polyangia bacterium]|jgi:glucosylceramidase